MLNFILINHISNNFTSCNKYSQRIGKAAFFIKKVIEQYDYVFGKAPNWYWICSSMLFQLTSLFELKTCGCTVIYIIVELHALTSKYKWIFGTV